MDGLDAVVERLRLWEVVSVQLRPDNDPSGLGLIHCPEFMHRKPDLWYGVFEGDADDAESLLYEAMASPGEVFVSVSAEGGLDLDSSTVDEESFPWCHWRLVVGAVRAASGQWVVRAGPAGL